MTRRWRPQSLEEDQVWGDTGEDNSKNLKSSEEPKYLGGFFGGRHVLTSGEIDSRLHLSHSVCVITGWSVVSVNPARAPHHLSGIPTSCEFQNTISDTGVWICVPLLYR